MYYTMTMSCLKSGNLLFQCKLNTVGISSAYDYIIRTKYRVT